MDITDMSSIKKNFMKNPEGSSLDHQTKTALDTSLGIKMLKSPVNVLAKHTIRSTTQLIEVILCTQEPMQKQISSHNY